MIAAAISPTVTPRRDVERELADVQRGR